VFERDFALPTKPFYHKPHSDEHNILFEYCFPNIVLFINTILSIRINYLGKKNLYPSIYEARHQRWFHYDIFNGKLVTTRLRMYKDYHQKIIKVGTITR
jgi:hypothetical protein